MGVRRLQPSLQDFFSIISRAKVLLAFYYFYMAYVHVSILFVTALWAALYNFINGLAKPFGGGGGGERCKL